MKKIQTGKEEITVLALLALWSVSAITSLPGLAISPIMGSLETVFPHASDLEIQMLTSLPSFFILPFLFLSGRLAASGNKIKILYLGLIVFFLSGVSCFFVNTIFGLIVASCVLGAGVGIVIPLSTGLIAEYFDGRRRTHQLGISSAVNNLTLVVATYMVGRLADINWHAPFAVYCLPIISIVLCRFLPAPPPVAKKEVEKTMQKSGWNMNRLGGLMILYFLITYMVLAVPLNLPFLMEGVGMGSENSGTVISLFFLAITLPGFFITRIADRLGSWINVVCMLAVAVGLLLVFMSKTMGVLVIGALAAGAGYGVMQPVIYDKASKTVSPDKVVMALAFVMSVNYFAVIAAPFIIKLLGVVFASSSNALVFIVNAVLAFALSVFVFTRRKGFVFGK